MRAYTDLSVNSREVGLLIVPPEPEIQNFKKIVRDILVPSVSGCFVDLPQVAL